MGPDAVTVGDPVRFDEERSRIAQKRRGLDSISIEPRKSDKVRMIESKLNETTSPLNFSDAPLREVIEYIRPVPASTSTPTTAYSSRRVSRSTGR